VATKSRNIKDQRSAQVGSKKQQARQFPLVVQRGTSTRAASLNNRRNHPSEDPSSSSSSSPAPSDNENDQDGWTSGDKLTPRTPKQDSEDYKKGDTERYKQFVLSILKESASMDLWKRAGINTVESFWLSLRFVRSIHTIISL
jgi:hypothetical protein